MAKDLIVRSSTEEFIIFKLQEKDKGIQVRYENETLWMTQKAMAELFNVEQPAIAKHLINIYNEGELDKNSTYSKMELVQKEGTRNVKRNVEFYNLDAIISVGYRVNSLRATQFRRWATNVLKTFTIQGYVLDKERMKNGSFIDKDYFEKLLEEKRITEEEYDESLLLPLKFGAVSMAQKTGATIIPVVTTGKYVFKNNHLNSRFGNPIKVPADMNLEEAKELLHDKDMEEFAKEELSIAEGEKIRLESELEVLLIPHDPNDDKNVIVEIRGAAGGDEANIFAGDLFDMYQKYANGLGWKIEVLNAEEGTAGGYSQIEFMVKGEGAYSKLKYESGAHRVQRVPATESQGRVHTSTATVLVMPEAEEFDYELDESEVRIDITRSSGCGGQGVNTTDSAVRLTHIPTGIIVYSQTERSQIKNKEKAFKILKTRLYDLKLREQEEANHAERKNKIGTGDRSEKIRTYNYPQNRLTDHRIGFTSMNLDRIMDGELGVVIDELINENQRRELEGTLEN